MLGWGNLYLNGLVILYIRLLFKKYESVKGYICIKMIYCFLEWYNYY